MDGEELKIEELELEVKCRIKST
uniref:Uncharacterized protein n=1 Tax=Rhizophora mucronata TaxID=61149 RepID=A0A2P2J333_RHIMU